MTWTIRPDLEASLSEELLRKLKRYGMFEICTRTENRNTILRVCCGDLAEEDEITYHHLSMWEFEFYAEIDSVKRIARNILNKIDRLKP